MPVPGHSNVDCSDGWECLPERSAAKSAFVQKVQKTGGLLSQAARNQTQGVEGRQGSSPTQTGGVKVSLFTVAVMAKVERYTSSRSEEKRVVRMTHLVAKLVPTASAQLMATSTLEFHAPLPVSKADCPFFGIVSIN